MANTAITKAAKTLKRINESNKMQRIKNAARSAETQIGAGVVAGSVAGGFVDKKYGNTWGDGQGSADFHGVPVNGAVGLGLAIAAAMVPKLPGRNLIGGAGLGLIGAAAYRYTYDNFDADPQA